MSLWKIAWRSIQQRSLASSLTGLSMALGIMLVVAVLVIHGIINRSFLNNSDLGYDVVVGAKGGRLELVMNSVYYLARPVENIPYTFYQEFSEGRFKPMVAKAIPLCLGDVYQDFRVIGTTAGFFNDLDYGGQKYTFAEGRNFEPDEFFGAVVGATVARDTGLKVGSKFQPTHSGPEGHTHEEQFQVVGVLAPTGTPNDRGVFVNMEGFYLMEGHAKPVAKVEGAADHADHADAPHDEKHAHDEKHEHDEKHDEAAHEPAGEPTAKPQVEAEHAAEAHAEKHEHDEKHAGDEKHAHDEKEHEAHAHEGHEHAGHGHDAHEHHHEPLPVEQREVTAVLVLTGGPVPGIYSSSLLQQVNEGQVAQAVHPIREIAVLFMTFVDPLRTVLLCLTVLIVIVSGIGILVSIYNSMSERRHEIAVIRALGAGRRTVMFIVLLESILLSLMGGLAGWLVGHALIGALSPWIAQQTGVSVGFLQFVNYELVIIPGLILLATLVGYLPAMAAYRTDVAKSLSATP